MLAERLVQAGFDSNDFKIYEAVEKKPSQLAYSEVLKDIQEQGIELEEVKIYGNHSDDFEALPTELRDNFEYVNFVHQSASLSRFIINDDDLHKRNPKVTIEVPQEWNKNQY